MCTVVRRSLQSAIVVFTVICSRSQLRVSCAPRIVQPGSTPIPSCVHSKQRPQKVKSSEPTLRYQANPPYFITGKGAAITFRERHTNEGRTLVGVPPAESRGSVGNKANSARTKIEADESVVDELVGFAHSQAR